MLEQLIRCSGNNRLSVPLLLSVKIDYMQLYTKSSFALRPIRMRSEPEYMTVLIKKGSI
jgi:hypothetical protein